MIIMSSVLSRKRQRTYWLPRELIMMVLKFKTMVYKKERKEWYEEKLAILGQRYQPFHIFDSTFIFLRNPKDEGEDGFMRTHYKMEYKFGSPRITFMKIEKIVYHVESNSYKKCFNVGAVIY